MNMIENGVINHQFDWLMQPDYRSDSSGHLIINTQPDTDFWQRTHYGFRRDNGHCLLANQTQDFCMSVKTEYHAKMQYDQAGLYIRVDSDNWIKTSTEYENERHSRLGSVVTNHGYSDWATIDIEGSVSEMWYKIQSKNQLKDYLIEYSTDGMDWRQLRITHLHKDSRSIKIGIYACSPMSSSFEVKFSHFQVGDTMWL